MTTNVKTEDDDASKTSERANVKLYVVVACIAALVLVAIIQASCTIFKMSRRGSSLQKVRGFNIQIAWTGRKMRGSRRMFEPDFLDSKLLADDKSVGHLALSAHTQGAAPRYPTHICPLTSQH